MWTRVLVSVTRRTPPTPPSSSPRRFGTVSPLQSGAANSGQPDFWSGPGRARDRVRRRAARSQVRATTILVRGAVAACVLFAPIACTTPGTDPQSEGTATNQYGDARTDTAPLVKYFPVIGNPESAQWVTWNNATERAPGPTIYWIEAVIRLTPADADRLRNSYHPTPTTASPELKSQVQQYVPPGRYLSGPELDQALRSGPEWGGNATGYLQEGAPIMVVSGSGGG